MAVGTVAQRGSPGRGHMAERRSAGWRRVWGPPQRTPHVTAHRWRLDSGAARSLALSGVLSLNLSLERTPPGLVVAVPVDGGLQA